MKKNIFLLIVALAFTTLYFSSCNLGGKEVTISGVVTDDRNLPLEGVLVRLGEHELITTSTGTFLFDKVKYKGDLIRVGFEKEGYFRVSRVDREKGDVTEMKVMLLPHILTETFGAKEGIKMELGDGASLTIPEDAFGKYTDNVTINVSRASSRQYQFPFVIPGGDLLTDQNELLTTYVLLAVELMNKENKSIELAGDKMAKLEFEVDDASVSLSPKELGLFHYNEKDGKWVEEGKAILEGSKYMAEVSHFSFWALGTASAEKATITGKVIDRNGRAIAGQEVRVDQTSVITDKNGEYKAVVNVDVQFAVGMNYKGFQIALDAGPLEAGETGSIDISVPPMTYVTGALVDCDNSPIAGQANLTWGEPDYSNLYTKDGQFELSVPSAVPQSVLTLTVGKFSVKQDVTNNNQQAEINLGEIVVCDTTKSADDDEEDKEQKEEVKKKKDDDKPKKSEKKVNPVGKYNFSKRSDGKVLVNYHYIILNADGTYEQAYQPKNSGNYVGGDNGTWKLDGESLALTTAGNYSTSYTLKGNEITRTSDDGVTFYFYR